VTKTGQMQGKTTMATPSGFRGVLTLGPKRDISRLGAGQMAGFCHNPSGRASFASCLRCLGSTTLFVGRRRLRASACDKIRTVAALISIGIGSNPPHGNLA
jgi:hypothetical protein